MTGTIPIPDDIRDQYERTNSLRALGDHYGVHHKTARKWLDSLGITPKEQNYGRRPMPEDFQEMTVRMSQENLKKHYKARIQVIKRWQDELAAQGKPHVYEAVFTPRIQKESILTAVNNFWDINSVAASLNCGKDYLWKCCDFYKIDLKDRLSNRREVARQMAWEENDDNYSDNPHSVLRGAALAIQSCVSEWSAGMGMQVSEASQCLPFDMDLLEEEMGELWEGIQSGSRVEQLDALADLVYTCFNIAYRRNLPLSLALGEVHRSNETKTPNDDGKPTKGEGFKEPDLQEVLRYWDAR